MAWIPAHTRHELMRLQPRPPKILYKYFPPERLEDVLVKRLLRFSPPSVLNDPFDVHPFVSMGGVERLRALIAQGRHEMRESFASAGLDADRMLGDPLAEQGRIPFLVGAAEAELLAMQASLRHAISREIGLLCLSRTPHSTLMWSHYGKNHFGFAVGFDTRSSFFHIDEDSFALAAVVYSRRRPGFSSHTEVPGSPLFVKSADWKYEQEWRVVRRLKNATCVVGERHDPVHLFQFPKGTAKLLILGCNTPHHERVQASRLLRTEVDTLGEVSLFHAEPDAQTFALNLVKDAEYRRVRFVHVS